MYRDITMIFAVLVSVVSVAFGVYKNIQASNARGFAYEQAYRIMGKVQSANISSADKEQIMDEALEAFTTPPPVVDLSRSRANVATHGSVCDEARQAACTGMASSLASANSACTRSGGVADACSLVDGLKGDIQRNRCYTCFSQP